MKVKLIGIIFTLLLLMVAVSTVGASGNSPAQLQRAGWDCMPVPGLGVHCMRLNKLTSGAPTIQVKVFDTNDPNATDAPFQGTELLIRPDIYNNQPCPQAEDGQYDYIDSLGYFACHHYDTSG